MAIPDWRLPPGVPRGSWDYARSRPIAEDYDDYHAENPLFDLEEHVIQEEFGEPATGGPTAQAGGAEAGVIADLGCGTARALLPLVRRGWRGLAIDLSPEMLTVVRGKAELEGLAIRCLQANLVELTPDLVADASVDHAICLFSTLGMIRGRENRVAALGHMRRILKPDGRLVLHVHNLWWNLRDPGGPGWVVGSLARGLLRPLTGPARREGERFELGDKVFPYRGVPNFFLHVFRASELRADLRTANLRVRKWIPLDGRRRGMLAAPSFASSLRAGGWIVVAERVN